MPNKNRTQGTANPSHTNKGFVPNPFENLDETAKKDGQLNAGKGGALEREQPIKEDESMSKQRNGNRKEGAHNTASKSSSSRERTAE